MTDEIIAIASQKMELSNKLRSNIDDLCNRFKMCLKAGICPICGADLMLHKESYTTKVGWGIFGKSYNRFIDRVICPNGHKLLSPFDGSDRGYPGNCEFNDCANSQINHANYQDSFDDDEMDDHPSW